MINKFQPDPSFKFDPEDHTYFLKGSKIPNTSMMLDGAYPYLGNRDFISDIPRLRGVFLHKCFNLQLRGTLDIDSLDPEDRLIVEQFIEFISENKLDGLGYISEVPMYHRLFEYGFTADALFSNGLLIDEKTGSYKVSERDQMQLIACMEGLKSWGYKVTDIMILRLRLDNGCPVIEPHVIDKNVFRKFIFELKKIKGE